MAAPTKDYRYSVEFNIHAVDAPGTRLVNKGDLYINICLLGMHKRTRLMPPYLPIHIDQKVFFDKTFKFCYDVDDIIARLDREHILIELIQNDIPSPIVLASYETSAKDFLYPYSTDRIEYTGLRRYILLNRTIDFPGISPSLEFSTSPTVDDVTGLSLKKTRDRGQTRTIKRSSSPTWRPASSYGARPRLNQSANLSSSVATHTISSAVKGNHGNRETQEKLRELAIERDINFVTPTDKTKGRAPFVVRHCDQTITARQPKSHHVLSDGLVINDYTLTRPLSSSSGTLFDDRFRQSRSISPVVGRSIGSASARARSPSPVRRSQKLSQSVSFERPIRSESPSRYLYDDYGNYRDSDIYYSTIPTRYSLSPTLQRESFRYRHRFSPATDLSDKVIHTLRRNLDAYSTEPWVDYN